MIERAATLAEERALGPHERTGRGSWWGHGKGIPRVSCGRRWSGAVVVRQQSGNAGAGRAVPAIALPRLAQRRHDRLAEAAARGWRVAALLGTPRPGEGRAT